MDYKKLLKYHESIKKMYYDWREMQDDLIEQYNDTADYDESLVIMRKLVYVKDMETIAFSSLMLIGNVADMRNSYSDKPSADATELWDCFINGATSSLKSILLMLDENCKSLSELDDFLGKKAKELKKKMDEFKKYVDND